MDVLSGISIEAFKILAVVIALIVGAAVYFAFFKKWQWALFGAVFTYTVVTAGVGVYVLLHINDPRWSAGKEPLLRAPDIAGAPLIGQYLQPLNTFLSDTANSVNEFASFRYAFPVAQEFFGLACWAFLALVLVAILALVVTRFQPSRQERKLINGLNEVRLKLGMPPIK